ncbi:serine hydrolase [Thermomonospora cellulosilytica]|uniref:Beta-lactamase class A n=1 Tax=Thermomonospora cellulosilytica TaxID=1411118 RepID=A0A7W3MXZ2_9ACTN|nr:serine hydrolase [Thermomonospora cellulosilytica]MBA9003877.1 beta-lactamase class A [Thermomonospora cellulosilytica]
MSEPEARGAAGRVEGPRGARTSRVAARIERAFRDAGVVGCLAAIDVDDETRRVEVRADEPVVIASVLKVPLLVAFYRQVAAGRIDPAEQVTLRPDERTAGPTGIGMLRDEVRMSLRDLAAMMITISDNAAADALFARVGADTVNAVLDELGLHRTRVPGGCRELFDTLLVDAGVGGMDELWAVLDEPGLLGRLRALDPARTACGTPAEIARLFAAIWRDEAAPPAECAQMRRIFGLQVWPHRLASGFPFDDVRVGGKTGTLPTIRNEAGVVEYPDGGRYAVAVFTRSLSTAAVLPQADAVIGTAARLAVEHLRIPGR